MATSDRDAREIPMSVRMERVLESVKRMSPGEAYQLFVKAGLMTEDEARQATIRAESKAKREGRRKSGARPKGGASEEAEGPGTR